MKLIKEFFVEHGGLSSTSAKHLSNLAQEKTKEFREKLRNPVLYDTYIQSICGSSVEPIQMSVGIGSEELERFPEYLAEISKMSSFTAYIMEAIKNKAAALEEVKSITYSRWMKEVKGQPEPEIISYQDWLEKNNLTEPEVTIKPLPIPVEETDTKVLIYRKPMSLMIEYFRLDTEASVLGKFCHQEDAPFNVSRQDYLDKLNNPVTKDGSGRDTCVLSYKPSVTKEELEKSFEGLQSRYREVESRLNKIKFDLLSEESARVASAAKEHALSVSQWTAERVRVEEEEKQLAKQYRAYAESVSDEIKNGKAELEEWRVSERERISKLKIALPESLQDTWKYLESLGKSE